MIGVIMHKTLQHLFLSFSALFFSMSIALPLGFALSMLKRPKMARFIVRAISLIQTIPGLAMVASIVAVLVAIHPLIGVTTTGFLPAVLALSLYGISPILTNVYTGIQQVSPAMIDVGTGLGMTEKQVFYYIQLPHAIPMMIAGIRIAGVWTIGMCTLASLVGSGGLGDLILQGLRSMNPRLILSGTIPAVFLAALFEMGTSAVEKWLLTWDAKR